MRKYTLRFAAIASILLGVTSPCVYAAKPVRTDLPLARVISQHDGHIIVQGQSVMTFVPQMPVWFLENIDGKPGLLLAEGKVMSVLGDRAVVELASERSGGVPMDTIVEPRFTAEARMYHATLPKLVDPNKPEEKEEKVSHVPVVRVRHRPPTSVTWGKSLWLEALLDGPSDKVSVLYRLGETGPYTELAMASKGDNLFGISVPVGETDPSVKFVQYYLVAPNASGVRQGVWANPAEPQRVSIDSVPDQPQEQTVQHAPVDRGSQHKPLNLTIELNRRFSRPMLFYRARGSGAYLRIAMVPAKIEAGVVQEGTPQVFEADIPARDVVAPGLAYYITVLDEKGVVREGFANSRNPQTVSVMQPQILSAEENRNQLSLRYNYAKFGTGDYYHEAEMGLDRLFFGFLIARLNGGFINGKARPLTDLPPCNDSLTTGCAPSPLPSAAIGFYRGRAGIDVHMGDYFSISGDGVAGIYGSGDVQGSGFGFRVGARIADEQVASIDVSLEHVWDQKTKDSILSVLRGSLTIPINTTLRMVGTVAQESVLQSGDSGLRLLVGLQWDIGDSWQVDGQGLIAGRSGKEIGPSAGGGTRIKF